MIELHTWRTPNGRKVSILLEEMGLPYKVVPIDIMNGAQFSPEFLKIAPNNKIPALVDTHAGISLFETGAIMIYLADKYGQFLPKEGAARYRVIQWLMWQMGGLGPMFGQLGFFSVFASEKVPFAIERFEKEVMRLLSVLNKQLSENPYVAGADYSIADMAIYPWIDSLVNFYKLGHLLDGFDAVKAWAEKLGARDGVKKGMALLMEE
jgi:GST-like protein